MSAARHFEGAFADLIGAPAARSFWMGRVGLFAALRALGVGPGDRVGICAYTCLGVIEPIARLGATPLFLDIDHELQIANESLEQLTTPIKALVVQHTFGIPCDIDFAMQWSAARGVPLIEDACHALGSTWRNRAVGTFGCASIYSFQWGKPISTGQGGMLVINDPDLLNRVDALIQKEAVPATRKQSMSLSVQRRLQGLIAHPRSRNLLKSVFSMAGRFGLVSGSEPASPNLRSVPPGFLRRMSESQARQGLRQLADWPGQKERRWAAFAATREALHHTNVAVEPISARAEPIPLRAAYWVRDKAGALAAGRRAGIDLAGWYSTPAHPTPIHLLGELGYVPGSCPKAEDAFAHVVTLPTRPALRPAQLAAAVAILKAAC